jgi:hypothetical protein
MYRVVIKGADTKAMTEMNDNLFFVSALFIIRTLDQSLESAPKIIEVDAKQIGGRGVMWKFGVKLHNYVFYTLRRI